MWWGSATREATVKSKTSTLFSCTLLIKTFLFQLFPGKLNEQLLTILKVKNYVLLNSVQEFTEIGSWQYLPFSYVYSMNQSQKQLFCKNGVRKSVTSFTGKHLCRSFFFNKGLRPAIKKRLWYRWFPVKFGNFLKRDFLQNTSGGCFYEFFAFHCHVLIKNIWKR